MIDADVALAVSPRHWVDTLHQFLVDHGGARVRAHVMGPDDALDESYQVLVIDDYCSFLTPRLVDLVRGRGRRVLGVYDPEEFPDGKQRLIEAGVDEVIEADAHPEEFLRVVRLLAATTENNEAMPPSARAAPSRTPRVPIAVVGGPVGGGGATEVALAVAARLAERDGGAILLDGDDVAPSLAQRLGLPLHPNLRTAIDALQHRSRHFEQVLHRLGRLEVLTGLAARRDWNEVRPADVVDLALELASTRRHLVINVGSQLEDLTAAGWNSRYGLTRSLVGAAGRLFGVGLPTPVGITRLLDWAAEVMAIRPGVPVHLVINRAPTSSYRRGELAAEITRTVRPAGLWFLPADQAVEAAAWEGAPVRRGAFARGIRRMTDSALTAGAVPAGKMA